MTKAAIDFNLKYNLNITPSAFEPIKAKNIANELSGRPKKNITQVFKRFFTNPIAVIAFVIFVVLVLLSIIIPYTSIYSPDVPVNKNNSWIHVGAQNGSNSILDKMINQTDFDRLKSLSQMKDITGSTQDVGAMQYKILKSYAAIGQYLVRYNPWDVINLTDGGFNHHSLVGTSDLGIDIWTRTWAGTWSSLKLAVLAAIITTVIGVIVGGFVGYYPGSVIDIVVMKVISIYSSIPSFFWYMIIAMLFPAGFWSLVAVFVVTGWISSVGTTRIYMWRYVNSDFMKAAQTLGVSQWGRIFRHALPNFIGIILFNFVYAIPAIIEGEAGLGFLGLSPSPDKASLGNVLNEMKSTFATGTVQNIWYVALPTLIIFTITMSLHFVSVGLSDAVDPKFRKR